MEHWVWSTRGALNCLNNKNRNLHEFSCFWGRSHILPVVPTTSISACISPTFAPEVRHLAQHCLLWEPESISPASTIQSSKPGRISEGFSAVLWNHEDKGLINTSQVFSLSYLAACYLVRSSYWLHDYIEKIQETQGEKKENHK